MLGEILDFIAGCIIQYGNYLKIKKRAAGWLFSMGAILYWILRAKTTGFTSQMFWHMISFMVAMWGYLEWRNKT